MDEKIKSEWQKQFKLVIKYNQGEKKKLWDPLLNWASTINFWFFFLVPPITQLMIGEQLKNILVVEKEIQDTWDMRGSNFVIFSVSPRMEV